ncbi:WDR53 protein, partial [Polypterus senegalus]|nr:WD repeat-containing protein 53 isoform X1 [Polypterus senegalus]MBN3289525.1 WDR53 protein [Polypterus senegalus]
MVDPVSILQKWEGGHSTTVLCVGVGTDGLLVSGAEKGALTLWNDEGVNLGQLKLVGEDDVTCVTFSPLAANKVYVSHGENVSLLDTRFLKNVLACYHISEDEINCLSVNETDSFLAAADDLGAVKILDLSCGKIRCSLHRHSNICSSVAFLHNRPQSLVSCGLDMQVMLWSLQKTHPLWVLNMQELNDKKQSQQQNSSQLFNPPLVHTVSVADCGNRFACGSEDGWVNIFRVTGSRFEQQMGFKAHSQGVSQVHYVSFLNSSCWLLTGGNDGKVNLWDVSKEYLLSTEGKSKTGRKKGKKKHSDKKDIDTNNDRKLEEGNISPTICINHGKKVNWLCPLHVKGELKIIVTDESNSLSVYPISILDK